MRVMRADAGSQKEPMRVAIWPLTCTDAGDAGKSAQNHGGNGKNTLNTNPVGNEEWTKWNS